ncbi:hypothetical protein [Actinoplanes sp. NPDC051851]|uniref:hypothetical protein n=1 Tax=Actinoplanes sp. NPDC051851 TaxID=3154753 RepID=UPI00341627D6
MNGRVVTVARISRWALPGRPQSTVTAVPSAAYRGAMTQSEMVARTSMTAW